MVLLSTPPAPTSKGGDKVNMLTSMLTYIHILTESLKGDLQGDLHLQSLG